MRKSRVITILCLSLILCFLCLTTNTFSWFNRADESGKTLIYRNKTLKQSSGKDFDVVTHKQVNGEYTEDVDNDQTLSAGERQCYKTEIMSKNESKQNISLYLSNLKSSDYTNTYIGVNSPMRTYKNVGTPTKEVNSKTENTKGIKDIYVGVCSSYGYDISNFTLHYWNNESKDTGDAEIKYLHSISYKIGNDTFDVYHAELPYDAVGVKFKQKGEWKGSDISISSNNFVCLYLDNNHNYSNAYGISASETPAAIKSFYSEASINVDSEIELTASGNGTLEYALENNTSNVAELSTRDDKVYVKGLKEGDVTLTVTSTGKLSDNEGGRKPDTQTFSCNIHILPPAGTLQAIPVVTNMEIAKYNDETKQNVVTVYWYIKNTSTSDITFSIDKINVTL